MTEKQVPSPEFVAAYMDACKDQPCDWNEIGYWYARKLWDASRQQAIADALRAVAEVGRTNGDTPDMHEYCMDALISLAAADAMDFPVIEPSLLDQPKEQP